MERRSSSKAANHSSTPHTRRQLTPPSLSTFEFTILFFGQSLSPRRQQQQSCFGDHIIYVQPTILYNTLVGSCEREYSSRLNCTRSIFQRSRVCISECIVYGKWMSANKYARVRYKVQPTPFFLFARPCVICCRFSHWLKRHFIKQVNVSFSLSRRCVATASLSLRVSSKLTPMYIGCIEAVKFLWHQSDLLLQRPPIGLTGLKLCAPDFISAAIYAAAGCGL